VNTTHFKAEPIIPVKEHSSFSLAYLGDAFFELWCRQKILQRVQNRRLVHQHVVQWVRCQTQAQLAKLTPDSRRRKYFPLGAQRENHFSSKTCNYTGISCSNRIRVFGWLLVFGKADNSF